MRAQLAESSEGTTSPSSGASQRDAEERRYIQPDLCIAQRYRVAGDAIERDDPCPVHWPWSQRARRTWPDSRGRRIEAQRGIWSWLRTGVVAPAFTTTASATTSAADAAAKRMVDERILLRCRGGGVE